MKVIDRIENEKVRHVLQTLKYSLYVITHPLDGFWDLTHEKRGSVAAANIIIALAILTNIWKLRFTSFQFMRVNWEHVNVLQQILGMILPIIIGCIANWSLSTLFDGKGTFKDIYMACGYALTPYVLIQLPMIFISNIIAYDEGSFYTYIIAFSIIWCGMLFMSAMMMVHDFSLGKALLVMVATLVGVMVIVFLLLLLFSLISDAVAYFVSLYKEIVFRLY
ncbi:MAG: YIP1 family protein [Oscillospiraceae bacterium]|nr:YIP1 family protein [Oscillospiraceae bacterium]